MSACPLRLFYMSLLWGGPTNTVFHKPILRTEHRPNHRTKAGPRQKDRYFINGWCMLGDASLPARFISVFVSFFVFFLRFSSDGALKTGLSFHSTVRLLC